MQMSRICQELGNYTTSKLTLWSISSLLVAIRVKIYSILWKFFVGWIRSLTNIPSDISGHNHTLLRVPRELTLYHSVSYYCLLENLVFVHAFLFITMLCITTRYIAARYLRHPCRALLIKYVIWFSFQVVVTIACSNVYTVVLAYLFIPLFAALNWVILLRDNVVLNSNSRIEFERD